MRIGVDLIEIDRIRRALERPGFRERVFTEAERAYCDSRPNPAQHYAGRFAGKEAIGKALGCGVHFTWREIEIAGRPEAGREPVGLDEGVERAGAGGRDRPLDDALAGARRRDLRRRGPVSFEPLYTAAEMRAARRRTRARRST